MIKVRKKSKENQIELSRQNIRVLMSKFEILQNNKLHHELKNQEELVKQETTLWQKGNIIKVLWQT